MRNNKTNKGENIMALTFDYTTVANIKTFDDAMHKDVSKFAWIMSAIRMNEVNANNVDEIVFRLKFAEKCNTNFLTGSLSVGSLKAYIRSLIGYKTNVRTETRNAFMRSIMKTVESEVQGMEGFDA
jgi:hypothetical protein